MEKKKISYADAFIDNFDAVKALADKRRKALEEVSHLFARRIECDIQYSKSLREVGNTKHDFNQGYI